MKPYENKIFKLIAAVNTRKKMEKLIDYFLKHDIAEYYVRTAINKYYMLPSETKTDETNELLNGND
jgi:hypothetical protein